MHLIFDFKYHGFEFTNNITKEKMNIEVHQNAFNQL